MVEKAPRDSIVIRAAPLRLPLRPPPLLLQALFLRRSGRLGPAPLLWSLESRGELLTEALQRKLPVPRLAAGVLGDRRDPCAEPLAQPIALQIAQSLRRVHVEDGLDPRRGHVRVLPARPRGAARSELDLRERDRHPVAHFQSVVHETTVAFTADGQPAAESDGCSLPRST